MSEPNNSQDQPTAEVPLEEQIRNLQATVNSGFYEIINRLDVLTTSNADIKRTQEEMYADLRKRIAMIHAEVYQLAEDFQPESFQNRILKMRQ